MSDGGAQFSQLFLGSSFPGFIINFYEAGTSTPKDVWSDESKNSSFQQVSADSSGMATWYADGYYRLEILDSVGNPLWDWPFYKITSDTATMWEGNFGTAYPIASAKNIWQTFALISASNKLIELGINDGTEFQKATGLDAYINVKDATYGAIGDGTTDDTTAFTSAIIAAKAAGTPIVVPYGQYLIDGTLNCHRVDMIGLAASPNDNLSIDGCPWPVLIIGSSTTDFIRVGKENSGDAESLNSDRTALKNFSIDMSSAPNNTRAVYCEHGVNFKTIKNIWVWDTSGQTVSDLTTRNTIAFDLQISDSTTQGLYYLKLDNLGAQNMYKGFWTSGDANDGMRVSDIGIITVWSSVQGITFKDSSDNDIDLLGIQGFLSGYDPSGTTPTEWGIWMDYKNNTIGNVYLEGFTSVTKPLIFTTESHHWSYMRGLNSVPNIMQCITQAGVREGGTSKTLGSSLGHVTSDNTVEGGSIASPQINEDLIVNPNFAIWEGGSSDIADNVSFAKSWTTVKDEPTATLDILQRTGSSNTMTYNSSVRLEVTNPVADSLYGLKQDLLSFLPVSGSTLKTFGELFQYVTIAVVCRPYNTNAASMRCRIKVDNGLTTNTEDYLISYSQTTDQATNDEPIFGGDGEWWTLIYHADVGGAAITKFEVSFGYYPSDTTDAQIHVDGIHITHGRHTQYGVGPKIITPRFLQVPAGNANTNTPSGATAHAIPIYSSDGSLLGYIPAYSAEW